jgi:hypothetical protein
LQVISEKIHPRAAQALKSALHPYGAFFAIIRVSKKAPIDGSSAADCKKNDGLEAIRTLDFRRVKARV